MPLLQIKNFFTVIKIIGHELSQSCGSIMLCMAVLSVSESYGCPGVRCHMYIYVGALQYTTLIFGFSFLWVLAGIKKDTMQMYVIDLTLYYNYKSLLLQYHKLYINTHLSV